MLLLALVAGLLPALAQDTEAPQRVIFKPRDAPIIDCLYPVEVAPFYSPSGAGAHVEVTALGLRLRRAPAVTLRADFTDALEASAQQAPTPPMPERSWAPPSERFRRSADPGPPPLAAPGRRERRRVRRGLRAIEGRYQPHTRPPPPREAPRRGLGRG